MSYLKTWEELPLVTIPAHAAPSPGPFLAAAYERYGPIFRAQAFGREVVYLIGPEANRFLLFTHRHLFSHHAGWGEMLSATQLLGDGLITMDGQEHDEHRRMMHPAFTSTSLEYALSVMQRQIQSHLERWPRDGEINLHEEMRRLTFAILAETLAGPSASSEVARFQELFMLLFTRGRNSSPERLSQFKQALSAFWQPKIAERREDPTNDVLGLLVRVQDDRGQALSDEQLIAHLNFLVGTGHETTSSLSAWAVYLLTRHPDYLGRVLQEQEQLLPPGTEPTLEVLKRMTVLEGALNETERLYPPLSTGPRGTTEAFEFHGYTIPAGAVVCYSIAATHLLASVFANPLQFDPDRFLPPREEHKKTPFALVGFGGGPRTCIATNFVSIDLKALLSSLLRVYRLEALPDPQLIQDYRSGIGIPHPGLHIRVMRK